MNLSFPNYNFGKGQYANYPIILSHFAPKNKIPKYYTGRHFRTGSELENGHFFRTKKKWHFEWPNQNSKTTFIVRTFPKNGPYGFDLVNLSLLGAILAIFQFCGFSGLFWPFFPCK